ncbi:hypothetical protein VTK73DRAFT_3795 [Phialemonium thermophilum]|uniref:Uncharacterized protein n=1 Tax=Phialemonium thermophilum TaxID=223376 RepID=A0ABR3VER3_9PEZI
MRARKGRMKLVGAEVQSSLGWVRLESTLSTLGECRRTRSTHLSPLPLPRSDSRWRKMPSGRMLGRLTVRRRKLSTIISVCRSVPTRSTSMVTPSRSSPGSRFLNWSQVQKRTPGRRLPGNSSQVPRRLTLASLRSAWLWDRGSPAADPAAAAPAAAAAAAGAVAVAVAALLAAAVSSALAAAAAETGSTCPAAPVASSTIVASAKVMVAMAQMGTSHAWPAQLRGSPQSAMVAKKRRPSVGVCGGPMGNAGSYLARRLKC